MCSEEPMTTGKVTAETQNLIKLPRISDLCAQPQWDIYSNTSSKGSGNILEEGLCGGLNEMSP